MIRNRLLSSLFILASLIAANDAAACAACGSVLSKDWGAQGIVSHPGFTVDLSYDYLNQSQQWYGSSKASGATVNNQNVAGQEIEAYTKTQIFTAAITYLSDDWAVSAQVPYVSRTHGTYGSGPALVGSSFTSSSAANIGDIRLIGRYSGFSAEKASGLILGVKLPTGPTDQYFNSGAGANTPLDAGLQIGSGSTDFILGGYTTGTLNKYGWFLQGTVQHAVATKSALAGATYRPGDAYTLNTGIRYAAFGAKFSPMLQLNVIKREADSGTGVPLDPVSGVAVSGGTLAYLAPGASLRVGGGTSVYGFIQLPVYQNVNSLQLVPHYLLTLGLQHSLM